MTAGSGKMGTGTSWESLAVVWRPSQAKALMSSKEQNELLFGGQEHVKTRWALSFFFDGLPESGVEVTELSTKNNTLSL